MKGGKKNSKRKKDLGSSVWGLGYGLEAENGGDLKIRRQEPMDRERVITEIALKRKT